MKARMIDFFQSYLKKRERELAEIYGANRQEELQRARAKLMEHQDRVQKFFLAADEKYNLSARFEPFFQIIEQGIYPFADLTEDLGGKALKIVSGGFRTCLSRVNLSV